MQDLADVRDQDNKSLIQSAFHNCGDGHRSVGLLESLLYLLFIELWEKLVVLVQASNIEGEKESWEGRSEGHVSAKYDAESMDEFRAKGGRIG